MYINPNTNIRLLKNVPLDTTYVHSIYFSSKSSQSSYFSGLTKYNLTNYSYQRVRKGVLRVGIIADNLYNCNYIMFQNTSYGSKWFYAFITGVEYVNNEMSEVSFEIDVLQTWFFDFTLKESFVEREHSTTDNIGDNIIPESLEIGQPVAYSYEDVDLSNQYIGMLCSSSSNGSPPLPITVNNVYCGLSVIAGIPVNDPSSINAIIQQFVTDGLEKNIISIFQYPALCGDLDGIKKTYHDNITFTGNFQDLDGYVPKNKKLFTYPYNFLILSNNSGMSTELRYEYFKDNKVIFNLDISVLTTTSALLSPKNYRNILNDYESGLIYSNFPLCAWAGDTYKQYIAQNKNTLATTVMNAKLGTAIKNAGAVTMVASGNPMGIVAGASMAMNADLSQHNTISQIESQKQDMHAHPDSAYGQIQCDSLNQALRRTGFRLYKMCIKSEFAKCIDDYFSMFGYATNRVKTPNIDARPQWNYTKTVGCNIIGSVPADDMRTICKIFDSGITFWKNGSNVGNYSVDNSI